MRGRKRRLEIAKKKLFVAKVMHVDAFIVAQLLQRDSCATIVSQCVGFGFD